MTPDHRRAPASPLITREVRWFFSGSLANTDAAAAAWFAGADDNSHFEAPVHQQQWREDCYLHLPATGDIGVKLRQGRVEIKGCHARVGLQQFAADVEGEVSCWTKWSIDAPKWMDSIGMGAAGLPAPVVIRIAKQRTQRSVRFSRQAIAEVPAGQKVDCGLHMELTRLRVGDAEEDTHWTLGFEAFSDEALCRGLFVQAVARLLEGCPARPLSAEASMSYPQWLQRLGAEDSHRDD